MKILGLTLTIFVLLASSVFAESIVVHNTDTTKWPEVLITADLPSKLPQPQAYTLQILPDGAAIPASDIKPDKTTPTSTNIIIALDTSKSMSKDNLEAVKKSLLSYIELLAPGEQLALFGFNDNVQIIADFTTDKTLFKSTLDKLALGGSITELYKAMMFSIDRLETVSGQRVLLVISDGKDEGKDVSKEQIIKKAKELNIQILTIGLSNKRDKNSKRHLGYMESFAKKSGGRYRLANTPSELQLATYEQLFEQRKIVAGEQSKRFVLQFNMKAPAPVVSTSAILARKAGTITESIPIQLPAVEGAKPASEFVKPGEEEVSSDTLWQNKWFWIAGMGLLFVVIGGIIALRSKSKDTYNQPSNYTNTISSPPDAGGRSFTQKVDIAGYPPPKVAKNHFILEFPANGLSYTLTEGTMSLGARSSNDIHLNDPTVSGTHAQFFISGQECIISDLNSTNGIFVNGERITRKMAIKPGDTLAFGKMEAVLHYVQQANHLA